MNDRFLRACRREPVDRTPLWIMRQAGRYLPEYRALRERADFLSVCRTPDLAVEATLQPLRRFPFDAAILFSDIMIPLAGLGVEITFDPGPRIAKPLRTRADVDALAPRPAAEVTPYVAEAVRQLRRELSDRTPLIGFCGAPFTLAAYLVEGRGSGEFARVRGLMMSDPATFTRLLDRLARQMADHLNLQIDAGAQAVQIFDSWAGLLSPGDFRTLVLPALQTLVRGLRREGVPVIYFAVAAGHLLEDAQAVGADVLGLCWRTPIAEGRRRTGGRFALQGNLDPHALFAGPDEVKRRAREVLESAGGLPGHVFNLGHGILPETPIESVEALVEVVAQSPVRSA
jgi:uroporphyrinogen decarboxylase